MSEVITIEMVQKVKVRKYKVDTESLKTVLSEKKKEKQLTNQKIAEKLKIPVTQVEHWFRKDNSFSIPTEDLWDELKTVLGIETTEFDKSIKTYEEKDNVYDTSNRFYLDNGISPTLTVNCNNYNFIVQNDDNHPKINS